MSFFWDDNTVTFQSIKLIKLRLGENAAITNQYRLAYRMQSGSFKQFCQSKFLKISTAAGQKSLHVPTMYPFSCKDGKPNRSVPFE